MTQTTRQSGKARQAYEQLAIKYPDCALLFRFDDTYEAFFDSAEIISDICGLVMNIRTRGDEEIPLVSVPLWERPMRVRQLLKAGYKVAVCEQLGDRDVIWVRTPGPADAG